MPQTFLIKNVGEDRHLYNFGSTSTKWIMIRLKATGFKRFSKYFHNYFLLLYLYFTSTLFLPYLYIIPTNHLPYLYYSMFPRWECYVPSMGTPYSHRGNNSST